MQGQYPQY